MPKTIEKITHLTASLLIALAALGYLTIMIVGFVDIVGGWLFERSIAFATELSELLFFACFYLALPYVFLTKANIRVDFISSRFGGTADLIFRVCVLLCTWFWGAIVVHLASKQLTESYEIGEVGAGVLFLPVWPAHLLATLSLAAVLVAVGVATCRKKGADR